MSDPNTDSLQKIAQSDYVSTILSKIYHYQSAKQTFFIVCSMFNIDIEEDTGCSSLDTNKKSFYGLQPCSKTNLIRDGLGQQKILICTYRKNGQNSFRIMSYDNIQHLDYLILGSKQGAHMAGCQIVYEL